MSHNAQKLKPSQSAYSMDGFLTVYHDLYPVDLIKKQSKSQKIKLKEKDRVKK